ncbi:MAG: ATP synthase F0 subunit B [Desulfuromonadaceae bacterium]|nr:ATP synthase F0 subunit B [Desulfuromonadaceae bacterium]
MTAHQLGHKKIRTIILTAVLLAASAGCVLASGDAHHGHADGGVLMKDFLYRVFNFAVTVAILVYFVAKPLKNALAGRRAGIEVALKEAQEAAASAEAKFAEYDRKLTKAEEEIAGIQAAIREEAEAEKQRIIAQAHESAEKIKKEASQAANNEIAKARLTLQQEAAEAAVEVATDILKKNFNREDQSRLVEEYKLKVGELH